MAWYNFSSWGRGGDEIHQGKQPTTPSVPTEVKSFDVAMTQPTFWACVRLLSETVAAMPLVPYETNLQTGIKKRNYNNDLWRLLNYKPNQYQTKIEFFEQIMLNLTCWGNAYVAIDKTARGRIISLIPYPSSQVCTELLKDGSVVHNYTDANGNIKVFSSDSMWHIKLFGNGIVGLSPLEYGGNALGLSKNLSDRQNKLAANGGKTNGILTVDQALKPEQKKAIKESFKGLQEGNSDELFVLEAGFDYQQTSLGPVDMQLLESRRYSNEEVARIMGVPSILINDTASSTVWGSGIDSIIMGFYKFNLKPYLERIESSLKVTLMRQSDWEKTDIEFNFDSLLRADAATRAEANSKRINSGQATPNEVRASEGLENKDGGDDIYLNGSLVVAGKETNSPMVNING